MLFIFLSLRWNLPLEPVRINVCYYKANKHHFPHNFIFASDDESQDIWGLAEYEYPGMVKVPFHNHIFYKNILINKKLTKL